MIHSSFSIDHMMRSPQQPLGTEMIMLSQQDVYVCVCCSQTIKMECIVSSFFLLQYLLVIKLMMCLGAQCARQASGMFVVKDRKTMIHSMRQNVNFINI